MVYFALVAGICLCLVVFDVWFGCKVMAGLWFWIACSAMFW